MADPGHLDRILREGAERAGAIAERILAQAYDAVGFLRFASRLVTLRRVFVCLALSSPYLRGIVSESLCWKRRMDTTNDTARERSGVGCVGSSSGSGVVLLVLLYYVGGAIWVHEIDDDPDFDARVVVPDSASRAAAVLADLIDREVNQHRWVANDPPFQPGYCSTTCLLPDRPVAAVGRFTTELRDRVARVRGSGAVDPDLERAAGKHQLSRPTSGCFEFVAVGPAELRESVSPGPEDLRRYNERLAQGHAVFERRADNLMATLDRISDDLGCASAAFTREVDEGSTSFLDFNAGRLLGRRRRLSFRAFAASPPRTCRLGPRGRQRATPAAPSTAESVAHRVPSAPRCSASSPAIRPAPPASVRDGAGFGRRSKRSRADYTPIQAV